MGRIVILALIAGVSAAPVVAKADGWRVALPERRETLKGAKARVAVTSAQTGPAKVTLPPPAHSTRAAAAQQAAKAAAEVDAELGVASGTSQRRSAEADDPDMPIAREDVRPHSQRYGRERLRADYRNGSVSAAAYTLPALPTRTTATTGGGEPNRQFAGHIRGKLEQLQAQEGIEPQAAHEPIRHTRTAPPPATEKPVVASIYTRLHALQGMELLTELDMIGHEIMRRNPVGTPVAKLRSEYRELVQFVSERTGIPSEHIYRVMDLESHGGQYWVDNATSGAAGVVQVCPIALEELQRLRPEEFVFVDFVDIAHNPALNIYVGMSYAAEKGQDWNHYSGNAAGYADYVLNGKPGA